MGRLSRQGEAGLAVRLRRQGEGECPPRGRLGSSRVWVLVALAAAAAVAYGPILDAPFFSDDYQIAGLFRDPASPSGSLDPARVWGDFLTPWFGLRENAYYRPLLTLSAAWDWTWWGGRPVGFHLTNLLAHVLSAWLLGLVLEEILGPRARGAGALAGFLFVLHPAGPEAVAWIAGRVNTLTFVPLLASLLFHLRAGRTGSRSDRAASLLALVAALLCKESAVLLPALALVADLSRELAGGGRREGSRAARLRRLLAPLLALAAVVLGYLAWRVLGLDLPLLPRSSPGGGSWSPRVARLVPAWILPLHPASWGGARRLLGCLMALFVVPPLVLRLAGAPRVTLARLALPLLCASILALPALALALGAQLEGTRLLYGSDAAVAIALALVLSPGAAPLPTRRGIPAPFDSGGRMDPRAALFRTAACGVVLLYGVALRGNLVPWQEGAAIVREVGQSLASRSRDAPQRARREGLGGHTSLVDAARDAYPFAVLEAPYRWKGVPLLHANVLGILSRPPFGKGTGWLYPLSHAAVDGDATLLPAIREAGIPLAGWSLRAQTFAWKTQPHPLPDLHWRFDEPPDPSAGDTGALSRRFETAAGAAARAVLGLPPRGEAGSIAVRFEEVGSGGDGHGVGIPGGRIEAIRLVVGLDRRPVEGRRPEGAGEVSWTAGPPDPLRAYRRAPIALRWSSPGGSRHGESGRQGAGVGEVSTGGAGAGAARAELFAVPSRSLLWSLEGGIRRIEIRLADFLAQGHLLEFDLLGRLPRLGVSRVSLDGASSELALWGDLPRDVVRLRATWLGSLGDRTIGLERAGATPSGAPAHPHAVGPAPPLPAAAVFRIDPADREFLEVTRRFGGPPLAVLLQETVDPRASFYPRARSDLLPVGLP